MRLGVFKRYAEIKNMRVQHKAFIRYFEIFYSVVFLRIKNMLFIRSKRIAQVYIIAVAAKTISVERLDLDRAIAHLFKNSLIGKDHGTNITPVLSYKLMKI